MAIEQRQKFAIEMVSPMVMFLILNVVPQPVILEGCDAEGAISVLPFEAVAVRKPVMNPF